MDKKHLRDDAKKIRAAISDEQRESDAVQLQENVIIGLVPVIQKIKMDCRDKACNDGSLIIGTYYPIGTEIIPPFVTPSKDGADTMDTIGPVSITGMQDFIVSLPVIRNKTTLEFYPWSQNMRLIKRDFDIPIPDTRGLSPVMPDILLMPLLLCDTQGNRIGYGAGHYDRYIASCNTKPYLVGVCFDEQIYDGEINAEPHDQKLDLIITPKRIIETA